MGTFPMFYSHHHCFPLVRVSGLLLIVVIVPSLLMTIELHGLRD